MVPFPKGDIADGGILSAVCRRKLVLVRTFFVEFYILNPGLGGSQPILGQHPSLRKKGLNLLCLH